MAIDRKPSGTAKAGLTTGIIGTSLGALNLMGNAGGLLGGLVNNGCGARQCADNSIVNYVNATFYPKMVADVTTGSTTTAQTLYNPLPIQIDGNGNCNCGC